VPGILLREQPALGNALHPRSGPARRVYVSPLLKGTKEPLLLVHRPREGTEIGVVIEHLTRSMDALIHVAQ
jgi:hypothetical protein